MFCHLKEYIYHHERNFGRDMNVKGVSVEALGGKEEHIIGHCRNRFYKVTGNLVKLCSAVGWKVMNLDI